MTSAARPAAMSSAARRSGFRSSSRSPAGRPFVAHDPRQHQPLMDTQSRTLRTVSMANPYVVGVTATKEDPMTRPDVVSRDCRSRPRKKPHQRGALEGHRRGHPRPPRTPHGADRPKSASVFEGKDGELHLQPVRRQRPAAYPRHVRPGMGRSLPPAAPAASTRRHRRPDGQPEGEEHRLRKDLARPVRQARQDVEDRGWTCRLRFSSYSSD